MGFMDEKQGEKEIEGLIIDFSDLSYHDSMEMAKLDAMVAQANIMSQMSDTKDEKVLAEMLVITSPKFLEGVYEKVRYVMSRVVKGLPDGWLVKDAPAKLSLSDPETYVYLRADKVGFLRDLIRQKQHEKK